MRIPYKFLEEWNTLKSPGDMLEIAELSGMSRASVSRAFNDEVCNDELFEVIATYYKEKKERIESFLSDYQD
jgi:DNA-binding LacI/PurR family transcriptional regulator